MGRIGGRAECLEVLLIDVGSLEGNGVYDGEKCGKGGESTVHSLSKWIKRYNEIFSAVTRCLDVERGWQDDRSSIFQQEP